MKKNLNQKLLRWELKFLEMSLIGHHPVKKRMRRKRVGVKGIYIIKRIIKPTIYLKTKNCFPIFYVTLLNCGKQVKVSNEF